MVGKITLSFSSPAAMCGQYFLYKTAVRISTNINEVLCRIEKYYIEVNY